MFILFLHPPALLTWPNQPMTLHHLPNTECQNLCSPPSTLTPASQSRTRRTSSSTISIPTPLQSQSEVKAQLQTPISRLSAGADNSRVPPQGPTCTEGATAYSHSASGITAFTSPNSLFWSSLHTTSVCMPQFGNLCSKERKPSDACHQSYLSMTQRLLEPSLLRLAGKFKESCTQFNKSTYTTSAVECTRYLRITCQFPLTNTLLLGQIIQLLWFHFSHLKKWAQKLK